MIAQISNGSVVKYPVNLQDEFPHISFPANLSAIVLPSGYVFVQDAPIPSYNNLLSKCTEVLPTQVNGVWTRTFQITDLSPDQQAINQSLSAAQARTLRNNLLRSCDWTQIADSPLSVTDKAAWATYRQALRDVPDQIGFPSSISWPTAPTATN